MSDFDLVITGQVVLSDRVIEDGFVAIRGGLVEYVGSGAPPASRERQDFGNAYVMPGAIDSQVHSRSQKGQEDFIWSTRSAAAGGVTTVVDMPYDAGFLVCNGERLTQKATEAGEQARVDFALYGTIAPADGAKEIAGMVEAGACGFKFSTFNTDSVRFPRIPPQTLYACFSEIARHGLIAGIHNENDEMVRAAIESVDASGTRDYRAHGLSRPPVTETLAMAEVYELGAQSGCSTHVVHCSIGRGYELCNGYRQQGYDATVETCIHYLVLDEENDVRRLVGKAKINPPIRPRKEVEALWHHLAAGHVTVVSTDHVSWSEDRKSDPDMLKNASGVPGLEVLYSLLMKGLTERGLPITWAARLLAANPARLFRLGHRKGAIELGRDADITVMAHNPLTYDPAASGQNFVGWSPYAGIELPYRPVATFLRGQMIYDGSSVIAEPGFGTFICPLAKQA
ncbi:dihydroorotase [Rhizobium rhizogenes]|uniref:dihydroorotase n=1 Tax=Rhizobium rhizogenes TaxID=359 RepID=UPI00157372C7|nr:amidohydrolase family protein [Rhizobium rhizogenes]NTH22881.1 amidohydrolase family protein [Rhizobium rhizogenes]NTH35910.1 amidohydrolase family protein [Rhizobium rhizogenes]